MSAVLEVKNLIKHYPVRGRGTVKAVNGVNLTIHTGETLGLVGESGSGKSTVGRCIVRLEKVSDGEIVYKGTDLAALSAKQVWQQRRNIQMVFQDPFDSLNPRIAVGKLVAEPMKLFGIGDADERMDRVRQLFEQVGLGPEHVGRYAHQLSGGQQQRVGIARALATSPELIVLDEPTTALDVSVQANILNLLKKLQLDLNLTFLLISHDLSVVGYLAHRVAVMYLGSIVEEGPSEVLLSQPTHPYTMALLTALPEGNQAQTPSVVLRGEIPSPMNLPPGCVLAGRCPFAVEMCHTSTPKLREIREGQRVACHRVEEILEEGVM